MPTQIIDLWKQQIDCVMVSCGAAHTLVLSSSGAVYSAGWGTFGRLGLGMFLHKQT